MYGGTFSEIIMKQMSEWLCRDRTMVSDEEIEEEFRSIMNGEFTS